MFDRLGKDALGRQSKGSRGRAKSGSRLEIEPLEGRALLAALAPIPSVTVEVNAGYQVPLNGLTNGNTDPETFTATTGSTTNGVSVTPATGQFWTIGVSHASSGANDPAFSGTLTFQLFQDLTPNSVAKIESLITGTVPFNDLTPAAQAVIYPGGAGTTGKDYYTVGGNTFGRVQLGFPDVNTGIVQGGALTPPIMGQVFANGYANEILPQLVFNGVGQLALANGGGTSTQDSQFFVTTGSAQQSLNGGYTIFGQLVAGANILAEMTHVPGTPISTTQSLGNTPTTPITITSSTLSTTNPNGVLHINTSAATANTLTNVTVTATDTVTNTQTSQTFPVITIPSVATSSQPTSTAPMLSPVTTPVSTPVNTPVSFQLSSTNPTNATLSYIAYGGLGAGTTTTGPTFNTTVANGTATVDSTGLVTVTPTPGFSGKINVLVGVTDGVNRAGSSLSASSPANYSLQTVTVNVGSFSTAPTLNPVTTPISASVSQTVQVQLSATNPSGGPLSYTVQGPISNGSFTTISNATAAVDGNGLLTVIPADGYTGPINLVVGVRDQTDRSGTGNLNAPTNFSTQNIVINVGTQASTNTVRFIQDSSTSATGTLLVTPLPQTTKNAKNTIDITKNSVGDAQVIVNGVTDLNQPALNDVVSIIVYGSTASDRITVNPAVTVPVFLSGGTGGKDVLVAGGGPTREQGWNATSTVEKQGESTNYLFGKAGKVTFVKGSGTNDVTFAGTSIPARGNSRIRHLPPIPKGTFYKFVADKLVKTSNPFTTPDTTTTTSTTTKTTTSSTKASTSSNKKK